MAKCGRLYNECYNSNSSAPQRNQRVKAHAMILQLSKDEFTPSLHHSHMCMIDGCGNFFPVDCSRTSPLVCIHAKLVTDYWPPFPLWCKPIFWVTEYY